MLLRIFESVDLIYKKQKPGFCSKTRAFRWWEQNDAIYL